MISVEPAIKRETKFIAFVVIILSALLQAVFLIIGKWGLDVLLGNLLGGVVGVLNFFLMGVGIQSALNKDEKDARATVSFSHTMRNLLIVISIVIGIFVPFFNTITTIVSIFFATAGVYVRAFLIKKNGTGEEET